MKSKNNKTVTKGIVFAGCSFTWGQGLYYYSNLDSLKEPPPHHYHSNLVRFSHYEYIKTIRFPRLVANHFNTFEVCQPFNGGATYSIIEWWENCFGVNENTATFWPGPGRSESIRDDYNYPGHFFDDFSTIVYQCTQWPRSHSPAMIWKNDHGDIVRTSHHNVMINQTEEFHKWLIENNLTLDQYVHNGLVQDINDIKRFLQNFEHNGVRAYIMTWPHDMVPYIKNDPWLSQRFIEFNYHGYNYTNIEQMMGYMHLQSVPHPELTIYRDLESFTEPPQDHHPSLKCHQVIADNVIRHIEAEQYRNRMNERT